MMAVPSTAQRLLAILAILFTTSLSTCRAASLVNGTCEAVAAAKCSKGTLLPVWEPQEGISEGDKAARAIVYFSCLLYMFLGVSIIADRFMAAIEVITSKEKDVVVKKKDGERTTIRVRIWNETVSNLTLMALGSSAPEILMSIIEIVAKNFVAGDLGPGTIVGSAAFNLFVIIGFCMLVIPDGECRRIHHLSVFFITAVWSIFAYLWLYMIIAVITPNVVDVWEAILTFLFFPATVITAYMADTKIFIKKFMPSKVRGVARYSTRDPATAENGQIDQLGQTPNGDVEVRFRGLDDTNADVREFEEHRKEYIEVLREIRKKHPQMDTKQLEELAQIEVLNRGPKSRAYYRMQATRRLTGSGNVIKKSKVEQINQEFEERHPEWSQNVEDRIFFDPGHYTVMENVGSFNIVVVRESRNPGRTIYVDFKTADGTANAGEDYEFTEGTLVFKPNETSKEITITIIDDEVFEEDEHFYVQLSNIQVLEDGGSLVKSDAVELANPSMATIMVLDDDHCGIFHFDNKQVEVSEACGMAGIKVFRSSGARGHVRVPYKTIEGTAKGNGDDYDDAEGYLDFHNDVTEQQIEVRIIDDEEYEKNEFFYVQLGEPFIVKQRDDEEAGLSSSLEKPMRTVIRGLRGSSRKKEVKEEEVEEAGRPKLGEIDKTEVHIIESTEFKNTIDKLLKKANLSLVVGTSSWKEQFVEAVSVSAGDDNALDEGAEEKMPTCMEYVMHFITIFWKLLFALVPPTDYLGGWLCFGCCILVIGIMTAIIGDLASHFGCTVGLTDAVTAITFVALGTSVPDLFASKTAAVGDKYADSSIGNVTGSNAVNVFLGIGIAWSLAAIYHASKGQVFKVDPGSLGFSVTVFCIMALIAVVVIVLRRRDCAGGELGGKRNVKILSGSFFIFLWILYVVLSSLENYCHIAGF